VRRIAYSLFVLLPLFLSLPVISHAGEQALSFGFGFAAFNVDSADGHVEGGRDYNFVHATYLYEMPLWKKTPFVPESFVAYINRPESGVDAGFDLLLRWYPFDVDRSGLFLNLGAGVAYTSIAFHEQSTHLLGILVGGIGYRYKDFFIDTRFRHYSNGNTASPNRLVNACVASIGRYF
jgi:hypothetical protein